MSFDTLERQPDDPLLALIGMHAADDRPDNLDLGVGVFRDRHGRTPVMRAVKRAEEILLATQSSKTYLGPEGDPALIETLGGAVFGAGFPVVWRGLQTPGGTGALRLAAELLGRAGSRRIWMARPSWANHAPIFVQAGIEPRLVPAYDVAAQRFDADVILEALASAEKGDAVLLHGCCHNPTGLDPDPAQWERIADVVEARSLLPLIDLAYQGLGDGWDADAAGARQLLSRATYGMLAYSCDKNFGLYRERTGGLFVTAPDLMRCEVLRSHLLVLARTNWSMPPDHGGAVVRTILENPELTARWRGELNEMRARIHRMRLALAHQGRIGSIDLSPIKHGRGMFAMLPLAPHEIDHLRTHHAIYMPHSGRINIAGFDEHSIKTFCDALLDVNRKRLAA
ncbi:amino acid aminotransferase [Sphingomonas oryzagri]